MKWTFPKKPFSNIDKNTSNSNTVYDLKLSHFVPKKTAKKCEKLGTFTQKILFLDYNKTKQAKSVTLWSVTIWGHGLYINFCKRTHYNWWQSSNWSSIEILIKIKLEKTLQLNSLNSFLKKLFISELTKIHGL